MRKHGIIALLSCTFALCLALVGCGGSGSGAASDDAAAKAAFVGTWNLVEMNENGEVTGEDELKMLSSLGLEVFVNINEDGTAQLDLFGEVTEGTWTANSTTAGKITLEGQTVDMAIDGNRLTFSQSGSELTFEKGEAKDVSSGNSAASSDETEQAIEPAITLADDGICTITVESMKVDSFGDMGYNLVITNNSDRAISVAPNWGTWSVNGKMIDPVLAETVQPGKYAEAFMWFDHDDVGSSELSALTAVEGVITVRDDASYDELATYEFMMR